MNDLQMTSKNESDAVEYQRDSSIFLQLFVGWGTLICRDQTRRCERIDMYTWPISVAALHCSCYLHF